MVCESYQLLHETFTNEAFSSQVLPALVYKLKVFFFIPYVIILSLHCIKVNIIIVVFIYFKYFLVVFIVVLKY